MESVELFAGAGGLAIGLAHAGFEHKALVENNKDACNSIRANVLFANGSYLHEADVRAVDYSVFKDEISLVSGGPPCQPFSLGGKAKGASDSRDMFPEAVRAVRELKPKAFIFENVKGLLRKSFSEYFEYILLQLQYPSVVKGDGQTWEQHRDQLEKYHTHSPHDQLEYRVVHRLVNSADYGVAQKRERVFFVGFRSDIDASWSFPAPTHSEEALLWDKWVTHNYWKRHGLPIPAISSKLGRRVELLRRKLGFFEPDRKPWKTVRDALIGLSEPTENGCLRWNNHIYKAGARVYPGHTGSYIDEPSKTLKAGDHGVPGGENMIRYESGKVRYFTIRESARIQSFPDDYRLEGAWGEAMRQLGNAVPAELARVVGKSVYTALESSSN